MIYKIRTQVSAGKVNGQYPYFMTIATDYGSSITIQLTQELMEQFIKHSRIMMTGDQAYSFTLVSETTYERYNWQDDEKDEETE